MDEMYGPRASASIESQSSPDEVPAAGSTRKVFVTFDRGSSLDSSVIVASITFFLREKVFPVVGDHCHINLHWDGLDLSTLHVRSVVPNSHLLVPRTATHNESAPERTLSSLYFVPGREIAPLSSPAGNITIKQEPIDFTQKTLLSKDNIKQEINVDQDDASSDDGKFDSEEQIEYSDSEEQITDPNDEINVTESSFMESDKQYADFRREPTMPMPPPISSAAAAYSMYLPQSPMLPMIPLMALAQSQPPYNQAIPLLVSAMQTMPQMPIPGLPQMLPGYSDFLPAPRYSDFLQPGYREFLQAPYMPPLSHPLPQQPQTPPDTNSLLQRHSRYM